jgi:hypothetical protein
MTGLEVYSSTQQGFKALVDYGDWRVALSNGGAVYERKEISSLSRHLETDEVFVLLKGSCLLLTGGKGAEPGELTKTWMEPGRLYNVTRGTWHRNIQLPGAQVLIIENRDTGPHNSESKDLPAAFSL